MSATPERPQPGGPKRPRPRVRQRLRTPTEARAWRRKVTGSALFAAAFILMVNALVGENGYLATFQARHEHAQLTEMLALARMRNQQIKDDIERLRTDPAALEDAARRGLHMIRPGEMMVVIKDPPVQKTAPAR